MPKRFCRIQVDCIGTGYGNGRLSTGKGVFADKCRACDGFTAGLCHNVFELKQRIVVIAVAVNDNTYSGRGMGFDGIQPWSQNGWDPSYINRDGNDKQFIF